MRVVPGSPRRDELHELSARRCDHRAIRNVQVAVAE